MILSIRSNFYKSLLFLFMLCLTIPTIAQKKVEALSVTGKITDASTGKVLTNAEIKIPGFSSAIAKVDGTFTIKVPSKSATLIFTADGFNTKEVALCGRNIVDVAMVTDQASSIFQSLLLPEGDVVNSNYSNAVDQKNNFSFYSGSSLEELLQREFGSLRINVRSGQPGIGGNIYLRGYNSLNGTSQPLIVVDGMIFDQTLNSSSVHSGYYANPLSDISPYDIERISVLKEGSSLYGIKGANGVIMIETKRAKELSTKVNAYLSAGVNLSPTEIPMMSAFDYRVYATDQASSYGLKSTQINALQYMNDDNQYANYYRYHNDTNWQDEIYNNSLNKNAFITVSGGDDVAKYALSLGYSNFLSVINNSSMTRLNTRFNADIQINRKFSFSTNLGFSTVDGMLKDDGMNSYTGIRYLALTKSPLLYPYVRARLTGNNSINLEDVDIFGKSNPVSLINSDKSVGTAAQYRMAFSGILKYKISPSLKASSLFGLVIDDNKEAYAAPDFGVTDYYFNYGTGKQKQQKQLDRLQQFYNETRIDYSKSFNNRHNVSGVAGFRMQTSVNENDYILGYNSGDDSYTSITNSLSYKQNSGFNNSYKYMSWFANANYNFLKKYFLGVGFSADASSRFGQEAQGGLDILGYPFAKMPSVSGSWNVSSEKFMKQLTFVDLFKIRASYAQSANDIFADNISNSYFVSEIYTGNGIGTGLSLGNLGNPGLKWESVEKTNIGAELALFNERLIVSADYFNNNTKDLIVLKSNLFTGLSNYYANDGQLNNTGYEVSAEVRLVNSKQWFWKLGLSAAHYKNEVTALSADILTTAFGGTILTRQGLPIGMFYGYKTNGVYSTSALAQAEGLQTALTNGTLVPFEAGDVRFIDINGDKVINSKDMQVIGNPNPDLTGNIYSSLQFNRFTLDVHFNYALGGQIYNALRANLESMTGYDNQTAAVVNRWRVEGQETNMPRANYGDPLGNARFSDRWIEDGSYLRLKDVSLSYKLPLSISFIRGITIYSTASNLFVLTNYLGSDPEISSSNSSLLQGIDAGLLPQYRTITFGLKVDL